MIKSEWFEGLLDNNDWYEYTINLSLDLKITYLIVILHNQVFNGGFHQYFTNGYGQFAYETIEALQSIKAYKKADLLLEAVSLVAKNISSKEVFRDKLLKSEIKELFDTDELFDCLEILDDKYDKDEESKKIV